MRTLNTTARGGFLALVAMLAAALPAFGQSVHIEDFTIHTELDPVYRNAALKAELKLRAGSPEMALECAVEGTLLDASGKKVPLADFRAVVLTAAGGIIPVVLTGTVSNPRKWTAETPYLYSLIVRLTAAGKVVQEVTRPVGFRKVEVKGMRLLVNGVPIEVRGVVTVSSNPRDTVDPHDDSFAREIRLLRESNINAVRSRAVPFAEEFLNLCDKHGFYVLADVPSLEAMEDIYDAHKNHPSVILWHVGDGSHPMTASLDDRQVARWLAEHDPTRPVAICRNLADKNGIGTTISDFHDEFMTYPEFREINSTPIMVSESHAGPNQVDWLKDHGRVETWGRSLQQEWTAIRDRAFYVVGGFICCWEDAALREDTDLKSVFPYVREAYAPIQLGLQDLLVTDRQLGATLKVTNRYNFTDLGGFTFKWEMRKAGQVLSSGQEAYRVAPSTSFQFPLSLNLPSRADRLCFSVIDAEGFSIHDEEFPLHAASAPPSMADLREKSGVSGALSREVTPAPGGDISAGMRAGAKPSLDGGNLRVTLDPSSGLPTQFDSAPLEGNQPWLRGPLQLTVRNEVTRVTGTLRQTHIARGQQILSAQSQLPPFQLRVAQRWSSTPGGLAWDLEFDGDGPRVGHEVILDLPILRENSQIFTPSNRGIIDVAARPTYQATEYAHFGIFDGLSYVLPLVSVFDPNADSALTLALPPDSNIPHLQVEWKDAKTLRLTLGHRGMGGGKPSSVRLLFYTHPADYRAAIRAYSDDFPKYFRPTMPRNGLEGSFYYDHIEDHPPFEEMARQRIRYLWSSFWFTHVGEYLPPETEWIPYTFANWWRLGEMMSDTKIRSFIREMNEHGIRVFAFFNVDEYGGPGSYAGRNLHGDSPEIDAWRSARFADAIVKDSEGKDIPSWEGCKVLNADKRYSFFPHLMEQVRRHLARLPEIEGFLIDRMDWASIIDYGHSDGLTMVGDKPAENMALPIAGAVQEVCRLNHEQGKRVYINQFYRVEVLRDVDGFCHENDYPPALGYLTPYRPVSAWHFRKPYHGDLLLFEAQLKRRLQFAVFPQMIAHDFPICQQEPDARAADVLEIFAPLFSTLLGKEQVLLPHAVAATGANDVNLFVNGDKNYVAPVTSRTRFLSRRVRATEPLTVTLRVPDAADLAWAHVYSADSPPYRATLIHAKDDVRVTASHHGSVSVVVVGKEMEPEFDDAEEPRLAGLRERLFPTLNSQADAGAGRPAPVRVKEFRLSIEGTQVGDWGNVVVHVDGKRIGELSGASGSFQLGAALASKPPKVTLIAPDEGVWFVPQVVELEATGSDGRSQRVAIWTPENSADAGASTRELNLQMRWSR